MSAAGRAWAIAPGFLERVARLNAAEMTTLGAAGRLKSTAPSYEVRDGVAYVGIQGVMLKPGGLLEEILMEIFGGTSTPATTEAVRKATEDPSVRSIVLDVSSPGGAADGVAALASAVRAAAARKTVEARVSDCCASAAFWSVSGASTITAMSATAEVGSVGAFCVIEDLSAMAAALGIKVHVIASAPLKGAGTPGTAILPEQLDEWGRRISDLAAVMVADIATGRRVAVAKVRSWATGQCWIAAEAARLGLIDGVVTDGKGMSMAKTTTSAAAGPLVAHDAAMVEMIRSGAASGPIGALVALKARGIPESAILGGRELQDVLAIVEAHARPAAPPAPAPAAAPVTSASTGNAPTIGRTAAEILAEASERAARGYPRRSPAAALELFWKTEIGAAMYKAYRIAPTKAASSIKPGGTSFQDLRAAAELEAELEGEGPDDLDARMRAEARTDKVQPREQHEAMQRFMATARGKELYKAYVRSRHAITTQRQAFVQALLDDEVRPLADAIRADGVDARQAIEQATSLVPAYRQLAELLKYKASRGAGVAELETGSPQRRRMVATLATMATTRIAGLAAAEFEPVELTVNEAVNELFSEDNPRRGTPVWSPLRLAKGLVEDAEDLAAWKPPAA